MSDDDNVIRFPDGLTVGDIPPVRVMEGASAADLVEMIVVGRTASGGFYFSSSTGDLQAIYFLLGLAGQEVMAAARSEE